MTNARGLMIQNKKMSDSKMKDLFSEYSDCYKKSRPTYSEEIIGQILLSVPDRELAWDVGAGSGQFTQLLAPHFSYVLATDISENQLAHAAKLDNVRYKVGCCINLA